LIKTGIEALVLRTIKAPDVDALYDLIQANRAHLTQNGDYIEMVERSHEEIKNEFVDGEQNSEVFGLQYFDHLIGSVSLIRYEESVFGLGYWISADQSGKGLMSEAVKATVDFAYHRYQASEIWAGITPSNRQSINLVTRLGFKLAREQPTHKSYKLEIPDGGLGVLPEG